jgi:transposase
LFYYTARMEANSCPGCQALLQRVAELEAQVERLTRLLEEQRRSGKRQAAPFRKGPPKPDPKRPGRKAGEQHGSHGNRPPPPPEQIDEVLEATRPDACPHCGGTATQFQTEIPRRPIRRQFNIHVGCCDQCRRRIQGRHPLQTSDATGAAASQLGPDAQAAVVELNKEMGLPHGKIARAFDALFGIDLSRGAAHSAIL